MFLNKAKATKLCIVINAIFFIFLMCFFLCVFWFEFLKNAIFGILCLFVCQLMFQKNTLNITCAGGFVCFLFNKHPLTRFFKSGNPTKHDIIIYV